MNFKPGFYVKFTVKEQKGKRIFAIPRYTICRVYFVTDMGVEYMIAKGSASRNPQDAWDETVGRKIAFQRAYSKLSDEMQSYFNRNFVGVKK